MPEYWVTAVLVAALSLVSCGAINCHNGTVVEDGAACLCDEYYYPEIIDGCLVYCSPGDNCPIDGYCDPQGNCVKATLTLLRIYNASDSLSTLSGFGSSLAFDGSTVMVGAPLADGVYVDSGFAFLYRQLNDFLPENIDDVGGSQGPSWYSGEAVAFSNELLFLGRPGFDANRGAVFVFTGVTSSSLSFLEYRSLSSGLGAVRFGTAIAVDPLFLFVSCESCSLGQGSVYAFSILNNTLSESEVGVLDRISPSQSQDFGSFLLVNEDSLFVCDEMESGSGACYRYTFGMTNSTFAFDYKAQIIPPSRDSGMRFGRSLACYGDLVAVSAALSTGATSIGSVYLFRMSSTTIDLFDTIIGDSSFLVDCLFGQSVSFVGSSFLAVSAPHAFSSSNGVVSLYRYNHDRLEDGFTFHRNLFSSTHSVGTDLNFGQAVSSSENELLISAPGENGIGAVYHYVFDPIQFVFPDGINTFQSAGLIVATNDIASISEISMDCVVAGISTTLIPSVSADNGSVAHFSIPEFYGSCSLSVTVDSVSKSVMISQPAPLLSSESLTVTCDSASPRLIVIGENFGPLSLSISLVSGDAVYSCSHSATDPHSELDCNVPRSAGSIFAVIIAGSVISDQFTLSYGEPFVEPIFDHLPAASTITIFGFCLGDPVSGLQPFATLGGFPVTVLSYDFDFISVSDLPILDDSTSVVEVIVGSLSGNASVFVASPVVNDFSSLLPTSGGSVLLDGSNFGNLNVAVLFYVDDIVVAEGFVVGLDTSLFLTFSYVSGSKQGPGVLCVCDRCLNITLVVGAQAPSLSFPCLHLSGYSLVVSGENLGMPGTHILSILTNRVVSVISFNHTSVSLQFDHVSDHSFGNSGEISVNVSGVLNVVSYQLCRPYISKLTPSIALPQETEFLVEGTDFGFGVFDVTVLLGGFELPSDSVRHSGNNSLVFTATVLHDSVFRIDREGFSGGVLLPAAAAYVQGSDEIPILTNVNVTVCSSFLADNPGWASSSAILVPCEVFTDSCAICEVYLSVIGSVFLYFYPSSDFAGKLTFTLRSFFAPPLSLSLPLSSTTFHFNTTVSGLTTEPLPVSDGLIILSFLNEVLTFSLDLYLAHSGPLEVLIGDVSFSIATLQTFVPSIPEFVCIEHLTCSFVVSNWCGISPISEGLVLVSELLDNELTLHFNSSIAGVFNISMAFYFDYFLFGQLTVFAVNIDHFSCVIGFSCRLVFSQFADKFFFQVNLLHYSFLNGSNTFPTPNMDTVCVSASFGSNSWDLSCCDPLEPPKCELVAPLFHFNSFESAVVISFSQLQAESFVSAMSACERLSSTDVQCAAGLRSELDVLVDGNLITRVELFRIDADLIVFEPSILQVGSETRVSLYGSFIQHPKCDCLVYVDSQFFHLSYGSFNFTASSNGEIEISLFCASIMVLVGAFQVLPGPSALCTEDISLQFSFDPNAALSRNLIHFVNFSSAPIVGLPSRCGLGCVDRFGVSFNQSVIVTSLILAVEPFCGECDFDLFIDDSLISKQFHCVIASESSNPVGLCYVTLSENLHSFNLSVSVVGAVLAHVDFFGWLPGIPYTASISTIPSTLLIGVDNFFIVVVSEFDFFGSLLSVNYHNLSAENTSLCYSAFGFFSFEQCLSFTFLPLITPQVLAKPVFASNFCVELTISVLSVSVGSLVTPTTVCFEFSTFESSVSFLAEFLTYERLLEYELLLPIELGEADSFSIIDFLYSPSISVTMVLRFFSGDVVGSPSSNSCSLQITGVSFVCFLISTGEDFFCHVSDLPSIGPARNVSVLLSCSGLSQFYSFYTPGCDVDAGQLLFGDACVCSPGYALLDSQCVICPVGFFCPLLAQYFLQCPAFMTSPEGSSDIVNCSCLEGYLETSGGCIDCDTLQLICNVTSIVPVDGFLFSNATTFSLQPCPLPSCSQGRCRRGYSGVDTLCTGCDTLYFMLSTPRCILANGFHVSVVLFFSVVGAFFLFFRVSLFYVPAVCVVRSLLHSYSLSNFLAILLSFPLPLFSMPFVVMLSLMLISICLFFSGRIIPSFIISTLALSLSHWPVCLGYHILLSVGTFHFYPNLRNLVFRMFFGLSCSFVVSFLIFFPSLSFGYCFGTLILMIVLELRSPQSFFTLLEDCSNDLQMNL